MNDCSHHTMKILSPAGSREAFIAAVENGADAIYLGGKLFNARHFAKNFELNEITELTRYAHLNNVRVYITLNILILNQEFPAVFDYVKALWEANIDAIIVQDIGLASVLRELLPDSLEIHASTQMSLMNSPGVRFAEQIGISQVVLAREVSLKDIKEIRRKSKAAIEAFCHGALCTAYSGQCLMSSMMGGRSGNRGQCAQPCRMKYKLLNASAEAVGEAGDYLLSTKDLCTIDFLDQLEAAGVSALKIEGRMKRPEYVAVVTDQYRRQRDRLPLPAKENSRRHILSRCFNRGFTDGYFLQKPGAHLMSRERTDNQGIWAGTIQGADVFRQVLRIQLKEPLSIGDGIEIIQNKKNLMGGEVKRLLCDGKAVETVRSGPAELILADRKTRENLMPLVHQKADLFKTSDSKLSQEARATYAKIGGIRRNPVKLSLSAKVGQPLVLKGWDDLGHYAEVQSEALCQQAISQPTTPEQMKSQLDRFGNTLFVLTQTEIEADPQVMVPASTINQLRRQWTETIEAQRLQHYHKAYPGADSFEDRLSKIKSASFHCCDALAQIPLPDRPAPCLTMRVGDMDGLKAALSAGIKEVYFGGDAFRGRKGILDMPTISQAADLCLKFGANGYYVLPRIIHEHQIPQIEKQCSWAKQAGVAGYMASNPGALQLCREWGLEHWMTDWPLNLMNHSAMQLIKAMGAKRLCLSPELTFDQIMGMGDQNIPLEAVIHGRLPLMILEHCLPGSLIGNDGSNRQCGQPCRQGGFTLEDRMHFRFPVEQDMDCRNWIFNAKTHSMLEYLPKLLLTGLSHFRVEAMNEKAGWIYQVSEAYQTALELAGKPQWKEQVKHLRERLDEVTPQGFTTGHYFRGVDDFSKN